MKRRFLYKANAVGLGGHLRRPVVSGIEAQASSSLPTTGGRGSSRKSKFSIENVVRVRRTYSEVVGSKNKERGHDTLATASAEDLDVLHVATVEKVVGALTSHADEYSEDGEHEVTPKGSKIVGFKINGYPVEVDLDVDGFTKLCRYSLLKEEYASNPDFKEEAKRRFFWHKLGDEVHEFVREHFSWCGDQCESDDRPPETRGVIPCTLVRSIKTEAPNVEVYNNVIIIPDFGKIVVAELLVGKKSRRLSMLRFELGSPAEGSFETAAVESEGDWFP